MVSVLLPSSTKKICRDCGDEKSVDDFYFANRSRGYRMPSCKVCFRSRMSSRYRDKKDDISARAKQHYRSNADEIKARVASYRESNRDVVRASWRRSKEKNRAKVLQSKRDYYRRNVDRWREAGRLRRENNRDEVRAYQREWEKRNIDRFRLMKRINTSLRRSRMKNAEGHYSYVDINQLMTEQNSSCFYCGCNISSVRHIEHKVPVSRGGSNWPSNLCLSCPSCNLHKGTKTHEEFVRIINCTLP